LIYVVEVTPTTTASVRCVKQLQNKQSSSCAFVQDDETYEKLRHVILRILNERARRRRLQKSATTQSVSTPADTDEIETETTTMLAAETTATEQSRTTDAGGDALTGDVSVSVELSQPVTAADTETTAEITSAKESLGIDSVEQVSVTERLSKPVTSATVGKTLAAESTPAEETHGIAGEEVSVTDGQSEPVTDASTTEAESSDGTGARRRRRQAVDNSATVANDVDPYTADDIEFIENAEDGSFSIVIPDKEDGAGETYVVLVSHR